MLAVTVACVDLACVVPGAIGEHAHALGAGDRVERVGDEEHVHLVGLEEPPGREHFPGPDEVELLGPSKTAIAIRMRAYA